MSAREDVVMSSTGLQANIHFDDLTNLKPSHKFKDFYRVNFGAYNTARLGNFTVKVPLNEKAFFTKYGNKHVTLVWLGAQVEVPAMSSGHYYDIGASITNGASKSYILKWCKVGYGSWGDCSGSGSSTYAQDHVNSNEAGTAHTYFFAFTPNETFLEEHAIISFDVEINEWYMESYTPKLYSTRHFSAQCNLVSYSNGSALISGQIPTTECEYRDYVTASVTFPQTSPEEKYLWTRHIGKLVDMSTDEKVDSSVVGFYSGKEVYDASPVRLYFNANTDVCKYVNLTSDKTAKVVLDAPKKTVDSVTWVQIVYAGKMYWVKSDDLSKLNYAYANVADQEVLYIDETPRLVILTGYDADGNYRWIEKSDLCSQPEYKFSIFNSADVTQAILQGDFQSEALSASVRKLIVSHIDYTDNSLTGTTIGAVFYAKFKDASDKDIDITSDRIELFTDELCTQSASLWSSLDIESHTSVTSADQFALVENDYSFGNKDGFLVYFDDESNPVDLGTNSETVVLGKVYKQNTTNTLWVSVVENGIEHFYEMFEDA